MIDEVSGSYDKTIRVWDAESGSELLKLEGHDSVKSVAGRKFRI